MENPASPAHPAPMGECVNGVFSRTVRAAPWCGGGDVWICVCLTGVGRCGCPPLVNGVVCVYQFNVHI